MRLFVGIAVPDVWRERLHTVRTPLPGVRWVVPSNYHVTLQFLGASVDTGLLPEIVQRLDTIEATRFEMEVDGLGRFQRRGRTTVVWASVKANPALTVLHEAVTDALDELELDYERKAFYQPHITLCYAGKMDVEAQVEDLIATHADFQLEAFEVREFALYESKDGAYVEKAVFSLGVSRS